MRKIYDSFLTSFGLICRIPIPVKYRIDFYLFPLFFPLIGLIVSGLGFGLFFLLNPLFSLSGITAFIIILSQYLVFNLFHFDGLLDCADAFLFNTSKEKRLSILTDKRTGSFAIFSGAIYIMFKFYLLEQSINILNYNGTLWLWTTVLFFYPLSGRIAGALMPAIIPPADEPGLAGLLKGYSQFLVSSGIILSFAVPLFLIFLLTTNLPSFAVSIIPFSGSIAGGLLVSLLSKRYVGGYTGDSIGLTIEAGEIFHLIIIAELLRRIF